MKLIIGDLIVLALAGEFGVIVQGCNCFCRMKRGIAKTIAEVFPEAVEADNATAAGDLKKLGSCSVATCVRNGHTISVVNAYTQSHWEGDGTEILASLPAIRSCLQFVRETFPDKRIGIPLIGAGLARGNWVEIERIILEELDGLDVTIVHYMSPNKSPRFARAF
jgi:O-acetyl-ADP-ribose deacetylase (regulator of RNase III)